METKKDVQQIETTDLVEITGGDSADLEAGAAIGLALIGGAVASGPLLVVAAGWGVCASFSYMLRM